MNRQRVLMILASVAALVGLLTTSVPAQAQTVVFINEIHYDNTGADTGEALEVAGPASANLTGWSLVLYNGNGGGVYDTIALSGFIPDQQNGHGTLAFIRAGIQNGSPDGVALVDASSAVVQFLSYEGTFTAVGGPADGMTSTDIGVSEPSDTPIGSSLLLTGSGTEYEDFTWAAAQPNTFGAVNTGQTFTGLPAAPELVINEIDYDQPGTDAAEFVEIKNVGGGSADLSDVTLELVNGTGGGASVYNSIALPAVTLAAGDYFVVCANAATVPNCDLDAGPDTNFIQNGAPDAVGLRHNGTLLDAVSYEGDAGAPYTEGSGAGLEDDPSMADMSIARCADGIDTELNNVDLTYTASTPGVTNACAGPAPDLLINEVDADQTGTDSAEFVELYDSGVGNTDLTGLVLVLMNGSDDASYAAFDLDGLRTDVDGYFVLCGDAANVANCDLDVSPDTNLIQNGADAVALYIGDAADFPNDTPVTTTNLIDALVYDTDDADDAGLLVLLNAGQPQVNERDGGDGTRDSNQRCPNGSGGARNTGTYAQFAPTPGAENVCEIVVPPLSCDDDAVITPIHTIQGSGLASLLDGTAVVIEGVVVGDFQEADGDFFATDLDGFYVQEEEADVDADPATSEGIFVFAPGALDVAAGDKVRVAGTVDEFFDLTELTNVTGLALCSSGNSVTETPVTLPVTSLDDLEAFEGMLVTFPQELTISEFFNFDRFNEVVLTVGRPFQPTAVEDPGSAAGAAQLDLNLRSRITLDDARSVQNPPLLRHPDGNVFDLLHLFRGGDAVQGVTGVLDYRFSLYRIQPTASATFTPQNPRSAPDPVGGRLQVASFNVLNYFTTLDDGVNDICGPLQNLECRGADNAAEFTRQRTKIIAALAAIDADVVGLIEIENHPADVPTADLVSGLNDVLGAGTYAYITTGAIGTDAIRVALIYKPAAVSPLGGFAILDSAVDARFNDEKNRPVLAQSFMENGTGAVFTAAVNHLKSKGSACDDVGDPNTGDGAGNCNLTRKAAAEALVDWLATDPTGSGDGDFMIIGDLNSYDKEDPIDAVLAGADDVSSTDDDYTDLLALFGGEFAYSYVFDGQLGYLDYALTNASLTAQVPGAAVWHINADEPDILDYDTSFKPPAQAALYEPNEFRASDHDPVIVGLDLNRPPDCTGASASLATLWPANHQLMAIDVLGVTDPDGDPLTLTIDSIFQDEPVNGTGDGDTAPDGAGVGTAMALVRAERAGSGNGRYYHISFTATDSFGNSCSGVVRVSVPKSQGKKGAAVDDGPLFDATVAP